MFTGILPHDGRISIHALLTESDPSMTVLHCKTLNFYPRSPYGERRTPNSGRIRDTIISIHALLTESDPADLQIRVTLNISIHALLTESDSPPR